MHCPRAGGGERGATLCSRGSRRKQQWYRGSGSGTSSVWTWEYPLPLPLGEEVEQVISKSSGAPILFQESTGAWPRDPAPTPNFPTTPWRGAEPECSWNGLRKKLGVWQGGKVRERPYKA